MSTNVSVAVKAPSLTIREMVEVPVWLAAGVITTVRVVPVPDMTMLSTGTKKGFEEPALIVRASTWVSISLTVQLVVVKLSSTTLRLATLEIVGGSLTAATVMRNVSVEELVPSLTLRVIRLVPELLAVGVTLTVRLVPDPARVTAATGTSAVFEEAVQVTVGEAVSASNTVKGINAVGVSSSVS